MIDPKELMIGNWVFSHGRGEQQQVSATDIYSIASNGKAGLEMFSPIPLTPQVLLACGFTDQGWGWTHEEDRSGIHPNQLKDCKSLTVQQLEENMKEGDYGFYIETYYSFTPLSYLHQLQNIFYALNHRPLTYSTQ